MDGISAAASIIGVIGAVLRLTAYCKSRTARYNKVSQTHDDIDSHCHFIDLSLHKVQALLKENRDTFGDDDRLLDAVRSTVAGCSSLMNSLSVDVLQPHEQTLTHSAQTKVAKWNPTELNELSEQLHRSTSSLSSLLTLMNCILSTATHNLHRSNAEKLERIELRIEEIVEHVHRVAKYCQKRQGRRRIEEVETGCEISFVPLLRLTPSPSLSSAKTPPCADPPKPTSSPDLTSIAISVSAQKTVGRCESLRSHDQTQQQSSILQGLKDASGTQRLRRRRRRKLLTKEDRSQPDSKDAVNSREMHSPLHIHIFQPVRLPISIRKAPDPCIARRARETAILPVAPHSRTQESNSMQLAWIPDQSLPSRSLFDAIYACDYRRLQRLIDAGASLTMINSEGHSALNEAVHLSDLEACRILLKAGLSPERPCKACRYRGVRPIHLATLQGKVEIVRILLQYKAQPDSRWTSNNTTALHLAARHGHHRIIPLLISAGASPCVIDVKRNTPLHLAISGLHGTCATKLLEHESNSRLRFVDAENGEGKRAVQLAIELAWDDGLALLHNFGADIHFLDRRGGTLLHMVARLGFHAGIGILVAAGLKIDSRDQLGMSPLHVSVLSKYDCRQMVSELLHEGADIHAKCRPEVLSRLRSLSSGLLDPVRTCPATTARPNSAVSYGPTALLLAAKVAPASTVQCLLDAGANLADKSACGCDVLRAARFNPHGEVFRLLFETSFGCRSRDGEGCRPLQMLALTVSSEDEFSRLRKEIFDTDKERMYHQGRDVTDKECLDQQKDQRRCTCCPPGLEHVRRAIYSCKEVKVNIFAPFRHKSALRRAAHNGMVTAVQLLLEEEPGAFANAEATFVQKRVLRSRALDESTRQDVLEALRQCTSRPIERGKRRKRKRDVLIDVLRRICLQVNCFLVDFL